VTKSTKKSEAKLGTAVGSDRKRVIEVPRDGNQRRTFHVTCRRLDASVAQMPDSSDKVRRTPNGLTDFSHLPLQGLCPSTSDETCYADRLSGEWFSV